MPWEMVIPAVAGIGSALIGQKGAKKRNQEASVASARQMAFQERMSNTSYQRGMEDMRKAGLNPILAGKVGGASTPTGSTYNPENVATSAMNAITQQANASSAVQNARLAKQNADYFAKKPYGSAVLNARPANIFLTELIERNPQLMEELSKSVSTSSKGLLSLLSGDFTGLFDANNSNSKDQSLLDKLKNLLPNKSKNIKKNITKKGSKTFYKSKKVYDDAILRRMRTK